mmetsp:Transcript_50899/g.99800  ORF Transcript_50899/g.99800 Transcript_50899/m.99800 type:complete len:225 (-) Transcript_50899:61-735(-)|eukprot:CAMPEP_0175133128 /NCGR_PEP_ID=MMETSP0087-20121206/7468_1 /TAXON_ID=136419 /ORGANISM="Unknown Unknown, Strain D1" /LENGTH=224 /DNA_ID=CAMNT_0016415579 /DNA_START=39 /DNA_END=713 /DNA_ORIENTATION=+
MYKVIAIAAVAASVSALPISGKTTPAQEKSIFALQLDGTPVKNVKLSDADQKVGWYAVHKDSTLGQKGYRFWAPREGGVDFKGDAKALSCVTQKSATTGSKKVMQYVCNNVDIKSSRFAQVKAKDYWNICASASVVAPPCEDAAAEYIAYALDSSGYYGCTKVGPNGLCTGSVAQYPITGSYFGGFTSGAPLDTDGGVDINTGGQLAKDEEKAAAAQQEAPAPQ